MSTTAQQVFEIPGDLMPDVRKGALETIYRQADHLDIVVHEYMDEIDADGERYRDKVRKIQAATNLLDAVGDNLTDTNPMALEPEQAFGLRLALIERIDDRRYELSEGDNGGVREDRPVAELRERLDRIEALERLLATVGEVQT